MSQPEQELHPQHIFLASVGCPRQDPPAYCIQTVWTGKHAPADLACAAGIDRHLQLLESRAAGSPVCWPYLFSAWPHSRSQKGFCDMHICQIPHAWRREASACTAMAPRISHRPFIALWSLLKTGKEHGCGHEPSQHGDMTLCIMYVAGRPTALDLPCKGDGLNANRARTEPCQWWTTLRVPLVMPLRGAPDGSCMRTGLSTAPSAHSASCGRALRVREH